MSPARILAAIVLAAGLAACAPDFAASPDLLASRAGAGPAARLEPDSFVATDGAILHARLWQPLDGQGLKRGAAIRPRAIFVALHGMNDYSNAFALPAQIWASDGILTFAYDQRGFGSNERPGRWPGSRALCRDLATAIRLVTARYPGVPVFAVGESMGGAVILDLFGGHTGVASPPVAGLILAAPAVWARDAMPISYRVLLWLGARLVPGLSFTGAGLHILASDNIPMLIRLGRDPHYIRATRTDTIYGLVDLMDEAYAARLPPQIPALLMYGAKDQVIPPEAMAGFVQRQAKRAGTRIAYYTNGWHMLLRDIEYQMVAEDAADWALRQRDRFEAPLPSGADRGAVMRLSAAVGLIASRR